MRTPNTRTLGGKKCKNFFFWKKGAWRNDTRQVKVPIKKITKKKKSEALEKREKAEAGTVPEVTTGGVPAMKELRSPSRA